VFLVPISGIALNSFYPGMRKLPRAIACTW